MQHFLNFNIWLVYHFKLHVWQYMTKNILSQRFSPLKQVCKGLPWSENDDNFQTGA